MSLVLVLDFEGGFVSVFKIGCF